MSKSLSVIKTTIHYFALATCTGGAIGISLMMLLTVADIIGRFFNAPIPGAIEMNANLMVLAVFLGLGYIEMKRRHVRVDMLLLSLKGKKSLLLDTFCLILALSLAGVMLYATGIKAIEAIGEREYAVAATIHLPIWPARAAIPIGLIGYCLFLIHNIFENANAILKPSRKE